MLFCEEPPLDDDSSRQFLSLDFYPSAQVGNTKPNPAKLVCGPPKGNKYDILFYLLMVCGPPK
jgi:hypothetical protein